MTVEFWAAVFTALGVFVALMVAAFSGMAFLLRRWEGRLDERFAEVDARFEARFDQIDARFDRVDARFDRVDARFDRVEGRLERVETELTEVKIAIARLEGPQRRLALG